MKKQLFFAVMLAATVSQAAFAITNYVNPF
jgi:hypothetical protein